MLKRASLLLGLSPAILVLFLFFSSSVSVILVRSLGGFSQASFSAYRQLFADPRFLSSLGFSFFVALAATALTTVLALVSALLIHYFFPASKVLLTLYQLPLAVPYLVAGAAFLLIFSQSGMISRMLHAAGALQKPAEFPPLVHSAYGISIILTYIWKQVPFLGILALSMLRTFGQQYTEVARMLGASGRQTFRCVTLPLLVPAMVPGSIILLAYNFGAFEVPYLMGRPHPSMVSVLAYRLYTDNLADNQALGLATCMCSFAISALLVLLYTFLVWRYPFRQE